MNSERTVRKHLVDYLPKIRRIVSKIAKDEGVLDDITQECCVQIIEKEKLWSGNTNKLNQWMNMVTRNLTIKQTLKKREKEKKTIPIKEDILHLPEDKKFSEDHIRWVIQQFNTLPKMQKKVLKMKYFENIKSVEIARKLNISEAAVSTHLKRSINTLKRRAKIQGLLTILFPWDWQSLKIQSILQTSHTFKLGAVIMKAKVAYTITGFSLLALSIAGYQLTIDADRIKDFELDRTQMLMLKKENASLTSQAKSLKEQTNQLNKKLKTAAEEICLLRDGLAFEQKNVELFAKNQTPNLEDSKNNDHIALKELAVFFAKNQLAQNEKRKANPPNLLKNEIKALYSKLFEEWEFTEDQINEATDLLTKLKIDSDINGNKLHLMILDEKLPFDSILEHQDHFLANQTDTLLSQFDFYQIEQMKETDLNQAKYDRHHIYVDMVEENNLGNSEEEKLQIIEIFFEEEEKTKNRLEEINGSSTLDSQKIEKFKEYVSNMTIYEGINSLKDTHKRILKRINVFLDESQYKKVEELFELKEMHMEMQLNTMSKVIK